MAQYSRAQNNRIWFWYLFSNTLVIVKFAVLFVINVILGETIFGWTVLLYSFVHTKSNITPISCFYWWRANMSSDDLKCSIRATVQNKILKRIKNIKNIILPNLFNHATWFINFCDVRWFSFLFSLKGSTFVTLISLFWLFFGLFIR